MPLADLTNKVAKEYTVSFRIDSKYAPLIKQGVNLDLQANSKRDFPAKRQQGATNVDLWTNGAIYPKDPRTGLAPDFSSLKELVIFTCKGESGLLGYAHNLGHKENLASQLQNEVSNLLVKNHELEENNFQLLTKLQVLQKEVEEHEVNKAKLEKSHRLDLKKKEKQVSALKIKYHKQVKEPFRLKRKDISEIKYNSGNGKKRRCQFRECLQAEITKATVATNAVFGTSQHLGGNDHIQQETAKVLTKLLTTKEKEFMLTQPAMRRPLESATNDLFLEVGKQVTAHDILAACDQHGVSQKGFEQIRKTYRKGLKEVNPKLKLHSLPNPHKVAIVRRELNANLKNFIGEWYALEGQLPDDVATKKSKGGDGSQPKAIHLGPHNSLIADLEVVQQNMVQFYNITMEELQGRPLIFVLKLDEAEIVKNQKFERVSITLMNHALDDSISKEDDKYFSVQADQDIWPIACCEVSKESHSQLQFIFAQTRFPQVIQAQGNGELLIVLEMGQYLVQWHLSADMKSIKCMFGYKHGANAKYSCIYCLQERTKKEILENETSALVVSKKRAQHGWKGGLFSDLSRFGGEPSCGFVEDEDFSPILPIPLSQVHICTLHANVRISEKILHLHFNQVWTMQDKKAQEKAIQDMETSLSAAGVHKGKVRLFKDVKTSGTTGSVVNKPSLNGRHVAALFEKSKMSGKEKVWMDICDADHHTNPQQKLLRMRMWKAFEALQPYFKGLTLTSKQKIEFSSKMTTWGKLYVEAFGEEHVTRYMHVLVRHAPWFVNQYGSLSVWSSQGMEKSHAFAKIAYSHHTQHGGGKIRTSPVLQIFQHWYCNIQHRQRSKELHSQQETEVERVTQPDLELLNSQTYARSPQSPSSS